MLPCTTGSEGIVINEEPQQQHQQHQQQQEEEEQQKPPNIIFVLIDDLGWGDVGFHYEDGVNHKNGNSSSAKENNMRGDHHYRNLNHRKEIQTPVMDRLVQEEGIELNRHYVHSSCTGTRTALQSGRFPVHVQTSLKNPEEPSSGMPRNLTGLAEYMKKSRTSFATHYVGKWDVGMASPKHTPKGRGYDTSLNYFEHKNDFWTQECAQSICCQQLILSENNQNDDDDDVGVLHDGKINNNIRTTTEEHRSTTQKPTTSSSSSKIKDLWDTDRPAKDLVGTDFEEYIFLRRMLDIIDDHACASASVTGTTSNNNNNNTDKNQQQQQQPLFLFYAPHVAHCPLQVPQNYLDKFDFMDEYDTDETMCQAQTHNIIDPSSKHQPPYSCRKQYRAMVKLLDDIIGEIVAKLQEHNMWSNTVMVVTSDNGGPTKLIESGATNFPLRGGKYSDWEGGVRATAFVSGGYIPIERRGTIVHDPIHICDWFVTLPYLAGVNVIELERQKREIHQHDVDDGIPPIDAVNVWNLIMGSNDDDDDDNKDSNKPGDYSDVVDSGRRSNNNCDDNSNHSTSHRDNLTSSPKRREIPLSGNALIIGDYKLIWNEHKNISFAGWTDPDYPNKYTKPEGINEEQINCTSGCLYNVHLDPGEHDNIANEYPLRVQHMKHRLQILLQGFFENNDRGVDSCPSGYENHFPVGFGDDKEKNGNNNNRKNKIPCACWMAVNYYGGFLGPYQEVDILTSDFNQ